MKLKQILIIITLLTGLLILAGCSSNPPETKNFPMAVNGVLDLSDWDFEKDGLIKLDGEWEFYWSKLLKPQDFVNAAVTSKPRYINVPRSWNKYEVDDHKLSGKGFATYRLLIKTPNRNSALALKIPRMFTAYSLWSDNELIASSGKVAPSRELMVPQYYPKTAAIKQASSTIQLTLQVSNFSHRSGGMLESVKLGKDVQIKRVRENQLALELFLFGCLAVMGLYHVVLFLFRKKNRSSLYFGLYCILIAIRTLFVGEIFIVQLFPRLNWEVQHKIQTLSFYLGVPVFVMFISSVLPQEFSRKVLRVSQVFGACFSLLVILTPVRIFTVANPLYQLITGFLALYIMLVFIKGCVRKRKGAVLITLGGTFFLLTAINDIFFLSLPFNDYNLTGVRQIVRSGNLSSFGLIILVFSQSVVLAMNSSKAFSQVEVMSEMLKISDKQKDELLLSLEDKVQERTKELEQSNQKLEKAYHDLSLIENSRKSLLTNISHDLKTPMTLIQGYTEAILDGMAESEEKRTEYLRLIQSKIHSLTQMTNFLFELSQLESRQLKLKLEKFSIQELAATINNKYRPDVESANLTFEVTIPATLQGYVNIDIARFDRVFSNLIYNAIKYTREGGISISFDIWKEDGISKNYYVIEVSDTGLGITEKDLPYVFDRLYTGSKSRSASLRSSGFGLAIAKEIVEYHNGTIWVTSKPGKGSSFFFTIKICD